VDTDKELGKWMYPERKTRLFYWFRKKGVKMFGGVKLEKITPEGLSVITNDDNVQLLKADKIIPAMPLAPNLELMNKIKDKVPVIYTIGDCANPGIIPDATAAGWKWVIKYKRVIYILTIFLCVLRPEYFMPAANTQFPTLL